MAAIQFIGTEREALAQNAGAGTYSEDTSAGYFNTPKSRADSSVQGSGGYYDVPMTTAGGEAWLHYCNRYSGFNDSVSQPLVQFMDASNNVIAKMVENGSSYELQYYNGSGYTSTGSGPNPASVMNTFDIHVLKGSGTAVIEWWMNGGLIRSVTGATLTGFGNIAKVRLQWFNDGNDHFSEVALTDTIRTAGWNVTTRPPTGAGGDTAGTGAYTDVNEINLDQSAFIQLGTAGDQRSFVRAASSLVNSIKGFTVAGNIRRVDATGPQQIKPYLKISGTRYYGTTFALTTTFANYQYTWELNPATGVAFTVSEANGTGIEYGWEAVT